MKLILNFTRNHTITYTYKNNDDGYDADGNSFFCTEITTKISLFYQTRC